MFECVKGVLLQSRPDPRFVLSSEEIEGGDNVREVWYEFSVEVGKSCEGSYGFDGSGGFPGSDSIQFLWVHLDLPLTNNHP